MDYNSIMSMVYYACGCFYMFFGIYSLLKNTKSQTNRQFLFLTFSLSVWSFAFSFSTIATEELSAFWNSFAVFGWGFFYSFFLHFVLILTNNKNQLDKPIKVILFYVPAFINVILFAPFGYFADTQYEVIPSGFGLINLFSADVAQIWLTVHYTIYTVVSVILLVRWWKGIESYHRLLKRQITYFLISIVFAFSVGTIADVLSGFFGFVQVPKLGVVFLIFPTTFLFIALKNFGVLLERGKMVFSPLDSKTLSESRLRLFQTAAFVFTVGALGSLFSGYFIAKGNFLNELLLAIAVWTLGIFLLFIPYVVKKHTTQNTLFLMISIVGMIFFIINDVHEGALTVWAVYIAFLLYSIVLDSKIHTSIFIYVTLTIQIVLWIIHPKLSVTIDGGQYLKRLFIISLSYFAVRYLTNEYASKLLGYQRFAKEQETLEKISTNFISVNSENAKEKVDEMFKLSAEMLGFNQIYLVEFNADYRESVIVNAYTTDESLVSLPFRLGVKVKTKEFPMAEALIASEQPVGCEDISRILIEEGKEEKDFFESRGINSYFVLPIVLENKIKAMLVIEDHEKANMHLRENQIYFLGIIANILGDTRTKTLYEEKLYDYAYFDETTKLANKNFLRKKLEQILQGRKETETLVIFDVELDNLRMINDSFGPSIGEQIVMESANILKNLMKEGCKISRVGEGKFVVVMPFAETTEQIMECAKKIVAAFSDPIVPQEGIEALFVTPTVGVAVYPYDGKDADSLLQNADLAGYEAKSSEKRIVFCSEQLKSRIAETALLTNRLFNSLENEEFSLEFQPQVSCSTGKVVGVEALLRWTIEDNRRIPPDTFIPMLEQTGLIHDVGLWVLEESLKEHNRLIAKGFAPLRFSINLSIVQFQKEDFVQDVLRLIEKYQVDLKYVELEITESMLSKNFADTINKLTKLKESGINIAIDDFGKGYSSLHRLELIPFDRIKIDKSIVDDIATKMKKVIIVKGIISLAKGLMAGITAEGVETQEQMEFMRDIDCDEIQGYYYSKPLPSEILEEYLKNG
ncbi:MAG: EAL domain-containing protein [Ruminococcaceae bacterium]|nr:EAL domain-containing protein [Oscillospiraceae bacterium]